VKVYTYSEARGKLSAFLEESKSEQVVIKRRRGDRYAIVPQIARPRRSPFAVPALKKSITRQEILEAIGESRKRV
jgi:hypothetical protein